MNMRSDINHPLSALALASLTLALVGCPAGDNNENNASDENNTNNTTGEPDAGGEDAGEDTGEDAGEELVEPAECVAEYAMGGPVAAGDGPSDETWVVVCDGEMSAEEFGEQVVLERADGSAEQVVDFGGVSCEPGEGAELEGLFVCELTLEGITEAAPAEGGPLGMIEYVAYAADGQDERGALRRTRRRARRAVRKMRRRHRVSRSRFSSAQTPRDLTAMPAGFAERGEQVRVMQTEVGRLVFGVTRSEDGSLIEVFSVAPDGQITTHKEVAPPQQGFAATGFEIAETATGPAALWWGFDAREGQLRGISVALGADGAQREVDEFDPTSYSGQRLSEIVDASYGITEVDGTPRLTARLLATTERDTFAAVRLGDAASAASVSLERELDALDGLQPSALEPGQVGLLSTEDVEALDLDADTGAAWTVDRSGKLSAIPLADRRPVVSVPLTSVQWPFVLELSRSAPGGVAASVTSPGAPTRAFALGAGADGFLDGTATELAAPRGGIGDDCAFVVEDLQIALARCSDPALGGAPVAILWDLSARDADERAPVTHVAPVLRGVQSEPAGEGDRVVTWVCEDDSLEVSKDMYCGYTQHLSMHGEDSASACAAPTGDFTRRGYRLNALPGETGITWAVDRYGDILIDGVPLVFDLTAPPIIFDAPGAQDQGAVIVANISHESATHAVWTTDTQGKLSEAGLLNVTGGEPGESVVFSEGDDGEDGDCDEGIVGLELTIGTVLIDFSKDSGEGDDGDQGRAAPVTVSVDDLTKAIGAAEPVALDLSAQLPGPGERVDEVFTIDPACSAPAESSLREAPEGSQVLATLTSEQAARPLVVTREGDTLTFHVRSAEGELVELATTDGAGAGASSSGSSLVAADFTGRIKRIKIRKKRIGSYLRASDGGDPAESGTIEIDIVVTFAEGVAMSSPPSGGDHDGDGIDDVAVTPTEGPTRVYFGDGDGGLDPEPVLVPGGVSVYWPPQTRLAASGGGGGTTSGISLNDWFSATNVR